MARELFAGIVVLASGIAQGADQFTRTRIALTDPGREHRVAARDAQPREHVRQRALRILARDVVGDERR